jgi:hypothetical protein
MRTHDLARELMRLGRVLQKAPNLDLSDLEVILSRSTPHLTPSQMAVSLSTLVDLSRVDKREWLELIYNYGFDIPVRPRDASRDILGKLLRYLETNEEARERLKKSVPSRSSQASPELMKALSSLLKDR